jgi:hypothetical protein
VDDADCVQPAQRRRNRGDGAEGRGRVHRPPRAGATRRAGASTRHQRTRAETIDTRPSESRGGKIACQRRSMPNTQAWMTPRE